jgi:prophage regulatory protein
MTKFLRLPELIARTGMSRSTIYDEMAAGRFPKMVKLAPRAVGLPESEYEAWAAARIAEREDA